MPRILIFTGGGKGKTTAALGMALRATGHGQKVAILQFVKDDDSVGEFAALQRLPGVSIEQCGAGFVPRPVHPDYEKHREAATRGLARARDLLMESAHALYIFDEICVAVQHGLVSEEAVLAVLTEAAPDAVVVLTGRGMTEGLFDLADTVTEMVSRKHGMTDGCQAQAGVEF